MDSSTIAQNEPTISLAQLYTVLSGVAVATKAPAKVIEQVKELLRDYTTQQDAGTEQSGGISNSKGHGFEQWRSLISRSPSQNTTIAVVIASLIISVTALRQHSRQGISVDASTLSIIWQSVSQALKNEELQKAWTPSRSAQGFLSVPLCSIITDGMIDELIRFHVWLPDGKRGNTDLAVHSHQPFAQSWILAGEGTDYQYEVHPVSKPDEATHSEFRLTWNTGNANGPSKQYSVHQHSSVVASTGELVQAKEVESSVHRRNDTYTIPGGTFHRSQVAPDTLHATFFYFDSSRGFVKDAPVLGPVKGGSYTQVRDPADTDVQSLERYVSLVRTWEESMELGREAARNAEWERSLQAFNSALTCCEQDSGDSSFKMYRGLVLGELGSTNRRFGRYSVAKSFLEKASFELQNSPEQAAFDGELGVVYRHMGELQHAKRAFDSQYQAAKRASLELEACRAIGNLAMVNYQLSQQSQDSHLLELAIEQLRERVSRCQTIKDEIQAGNLEPASISSRLRQIEVWMTVGLTRLAMCLTTKKDMKEAFEAAEQGLEHAKMTGDPTVVAFSRFFYGRAFDNMGNKAEGLRQYNNADGCTPAIAFCKEPSEEHHAHLSYLVDAGADMDLVDHQGYKALDYAVFNGDEISRDLVLKGLRRQFEGLNNSSAMIAQRETEAKLRKGYREIFQEKLRPVLLEGGENCIEKLRIAYAESLAGDKTKDEMFDHLQVVTYSDFLQYQRLPRSSDGLAQDFPPSNMQHGRQYVIFISYRWLNPLAGPQGASADDENNTQYGRIKRAVEEFLGEHPTVQADNLCLWMDYACVNQDDPTKGVVALPMILAQCDAVISLTDDTYYDRAWCCVEVMMIRTLKQSYQIHQWYEQPLIYGDANNRQTATGCGKIVEASMEREIRMADKHLSFESDREKVLFLERQSKLLG